MKLKLLIIAIMVSAITIAQDNKIKFGKVSKEEVLQKEHHLDKDAEAAFLYKKERLFYKYDGTEGFRTVRSAHYRIKVYKKSGLDWGTFEIPLYTSTSGEERIGQVKGYTFNDENGKINEVKLKKDGVFKENVSKYRNKVSISMPNVKEGSVIDLEYSITSDLSGYIDEFQFQYGIPVDHVDISVEIPEYYVFKRHGKGFFPIDITQSRKNRKVTFRYREEKGTATNKHKSLFSSATNSKSTTQSGEIEFLENVYKIASNNIPALKEVSYTDNIDNYRSAIKFELASTQFPNSPYKNYSKSWEDVAKTIYKYDDFGNELKKQRFYKDDVDEIMTKVTEPSKLASAIFDHVKNRMNWNNYTGVGCDNGLKKAYEEKSGNVADINLMLTSMLRYAGFKANPVLVSTKSHGIPLFPTTDGFNYVVAAIENADGTVDLMDATEKMGAVNILPTRSLNWSGRLVREDGSSIAIEMVNKKPSKKVIFMNAELASDGSVSGKMRTQNTGHIALGYRKSHKDETTEDIMDAMEDRYVEMEVDELEIKNEKECDKPVLESCSFLKENQTEIINGKIYFKPALFLAMNENPFKLETRDYPVDFVYPQSKKIVVNYKLPEGCQVESIPESASYALPDGLGSFQFTFKQNGNQIQFSSNTAINKSLIPPNYYASLKEFYNQMVVKHNEKIVLSKI
ncbi:DUF3857 domain-containing protein [Croceitalea sp. P059]|uniref:DUF3857 domain-containing protein n=1 Tax=Croceitalea sp. P059 TaxID=3075601 RepID=UPI0028877AC5|nr:DUF3857 domain-containing protein [Croceitalea sp. P059]MDT0539356.1 DUF3857 domain-containing protein [Croceitalea sp. P059]